MTRIYCAYDDGEGRGGGGGEASVDTQLPLIDYCQVGGASSNGLVGKTRCSRRLTAKWDQGRHSSAGHAFDCAFKGENLGRYYLSCSIELSRINVLLGVKSRESIG